LELLEYEKQEAQERYLNSHTEIKNTISDMRNTFQNTYKKIRGLREFTLSRGTTFHDELNLLKKTYFYSMVNSLKYSKKMDDDCSESDLFNYVINNNIDWKDWQSWLANYVS